MTDTKLSQLSTGAAIASTDLFYSAQDIGGGNFTQVKQPASALTTFLGGGGAAGSSGQVQYNNGGVFGGAANFTISSGNPNVTSGNAYLYNGATVIQADTVGKNWFLGNSGNLTLTGTDNFCEGDSAGNNITTGTGNMAMGRGALNTCTSGQDNVAVGKFSLLALTTGLNNSAIGSSALLALIDGNGNTGIGGGAVSASQHDSDNVGIGQFALGTLNGGGRNIGIGTNAFSGLTTASHNVGIGHNAGGAATTAADNTCIGYFAGYTSPFGGPNITSGAQNICIGSQCAVPTGTASGQISIGNMIYGTGCTGQNGSTSAGKIGIGIQAPTAVLHLANSSTARANLCFDPTSAAGPTSPNDGDMWYDGTNLKFRHGGTTATIV